MTYSSEFWKHLHSSGVSLVLARTIFDSTFSGAISFRGVYKPAEKPIIPFITLPATESPLPAPFYRKGRLHIFAHTQNKKQVRQVISNFSRHPAIVCVTSLVNGDIYGFWRRTHRGWVPVDWRSPLLASAKQRDIAFTLLEQL